MFVESYSKCKPASETILESAVQAVSNRVNEENNFKMPLDKRHEKLEDFSDEPAEKKRKEKKML